MDESRGSHEQEVQQEQHEVHQPVAPAEDGQPEPAPGQVAPAEPTEDQPAPAEPAPAEDNDDGA